MIICAVADAGPLIHLLESQALPLLRWIGDLRVPPQVVKEVNYHIPDWRLPPWIKVNALAPVHDMEAAAWRQAGILDAGEAEAIALVRQLSADWLLSDDAAARLFAEQMGIEVHGSLGIVLWAAAKGHLNYQEARQTLSRLRSSTLWISHRVFAEAQAALDEIFAD